MNVCKTKLCMPKAKLNSTVMVSQCRFQQIVFYFVCSIPSKWAYRDIIIHFSFSYFTVTCLKLFIC